MMLMLMEMKFFSTMSVHDVQFKDGQIVKINVYSREKEVESKEFSY